jgi:3-hydroxyacyl-CoA dehydrogenase/enoyl-CoA hydratase/3-hydroxybutyryl-CoA epimerase
VGALQLADELNLELLVKIRDEARAAAGDAYARHPAEDVIDKMVALGRPGRLKGAGFYDYDEGRRTHLWSGLTEEFTPRPGEMPFADVRDRMTFIEALETAACFEEGVIESSAAANIGSIMGIGFPPSSGGAAQFMTGYQAVDEQGAGVGPIGLGAFLARADELADRYGERVRPTAYLRELDAKGERFPS